MIFVFLASMVSLASALVAQYGFGLAPCELCTMQRVPYILLIIISLAGLAAPVFRKPLIYMIAVIFMAGSSIAAYHFAVERHFIAGPSSCSSSGSTQGQSIDDLLKKIQKSPIVACDQPQWEFHGITMAMLNALWSFFLGVIVMVAVRKAKNA